MTYRVTNPNGLEAHGMRLANEGNLVSDELFEGGREEYGWDESFAEKVSKTEARKATEPKAEGNK